MVGMLEEVRQGKDELGRWCTIHRIRIPGKENIWKMGHKTILIDMLREDCFLIDF